MAAQAGLSIHMSKCHIVGNHMSRLICQNAIMLWLICVICNCLAYCPDIQAPDSGAVEIRTDGITTIANFYCSTGYTLIGNDVLTCGIDGTWSDTEPICSMLLFIFFNIYTLYYNAKSDIALYFYFCLI